MFFFLSKVLAFLTFPLSWIFIILTISVIVKKETTKKRLQIASIIIVFVFGNSAIIGYLNNCWETKPISDNKIVGIKTAIVLGGLSYYDTNLKRIHFQRSSDRIFHALRLYKEHKIERIFISGGAAFISKSYEKESIFLKEYLVSIGVPDSVIDIESESRNTFENAVFTKQELKHRGLFNSQERFLLITSGYHMPRAQACFKKQGFDVIPYSVDGSSGEANWQIDELIIPNYGALQNWNILIHEWIGYVMYKMSDKI